jgi:hypothetical protein
MDLMDLLIALPALWYLGVPLLIKSTMKINARPALTPVTPKFLPEDVKDYFDEVAPKLSSLGFEPVACFVVENSMPNVTPHVQLWFNRRAGQMATANFVIAKQPGDKPPVIKTHLEFLTKMADGPSIATNNSAEVGAFKKTAACETVSATRLKDPAHLHRLHAWRETKLAPASAERFIPAAGQELAWFSEMYEESIARQVGTGYLQRNAGDPTTFQPTFHGAYVMTWAQMWPMKGLGRSAEDRRAEGQVRECAAAGEVKPPSSVRITNKQPTPGPSRRAA